MIDLRIRAALIEDAERILEIYSYYVEKTAISFEYELPTVAEFKKRMNDIMEKYPYLVVEKENRVVGFAYASAFIERAAYNRSCEITVYLDRSMLKQGLGRKIYTVLEEKLRDLGILNLYACIAYPETEDEYLNTNSADFHAHMGFKEVGRFHQCGYKFNRWYDMIWMEKIIGRHDKSVL